MAVNFAGKLIKNFSFLQLSGSISPLNSIQVRNYAARKGTRQKARKNKKKVVVEKVGFIPHMLRQKASKKKQVPDHPEINDTFKRLPEDNVWIGKYYQWKVYSLEEAVNCHRETHHPTMYNAPNAKIQMLVELDMRGAKKTKLLDKFTRIASIPHYFHHGDKRTIASLSKDGDLCEAAKKAGATLVGGLEEIKLIQSGQISVHDYEFFLAHPDILPELTLVKGLLKQKFPSIRSGTLSPDLVNTVNKFLHGVRYTAIPDDYYKDYGTINTAFGTLDMDTKHIEENFLALLKDILAAKPKRDGPFIKRVRLGTPVTKELFKIDFQQYLGDKKKENVEDEEEDDNSFAVIASN